ncbi:hypothetical protein AK966_01610 [Vibrio sp. PID23_8]|nr:hypothetical protein AK965_04620 [Vibrio sp. PID17_43]RIZ56856.1 hypothetical protein AK966_01610 [Vibrio sp. PID23_8]
MVQAKLEFLVCILNLLFGIKTLLKKEIATDTKKRRAANDVKEQERIAKYKSCILPFLGKQQRTL